MKSSPRIRRGATTRLWRHRDANRQGPPGRWAGDEGVRGAACGPQPIRVRVRVLTWGVRRAPLRGDRRRGPVRRGLQASGGGRADARSFAVDRDRWVHPRAGGQPGLPGACRALHRQFAEDLGRRGGCVPSDVRDRQSAAGRVLARRCDPGGRRPVGYDFALGPRLAAATRHVPRAPGLHTLARLFRRRLDPRLGRGRRGRQALGDRRILPEAREGRGDARIIRGSTPPAIGSLSPLPEEGRRRSDARPP